MKKIALVIIVLVIFSATACATATPTPTLVPTKTKTAPTVVLPTNTAVPSQAIPTAVPPSSTPTPTLTPTITPSPAPTIPAGFYVTNLRIDPNPPTRGSDLIFFATFMNTMGDIQNYKWLVYIYRTDTPNKSTGETTALPSAIPVGTNELKSLGAWKLPLGGPCDFFFARVARLDQNNQPVMLNRPDGQVYEKQFTVCAPNDLPSSTPAPTATPTPTPTFSPGLYVTDVRTEPDPPTRGSELVFYATFVNTFGSPQDRKWIVYIYKPGERDRTGETTATNTTFGAGIYDYKTLGYWKLPLGGPCEDFTARVVWFDNDKTQMFMKFENVPFEKTLRVCPP